MAMVGIENARLLFIDEQKQTCDLLKKLRADCIKSDDNQRFAEVTTQIDSLKRQLNDLMQYFPILRSAHGTLSFNINIPEDCDSNYHQEHAETNVTVASVSQVGDTDTLFADSGKPITPHTFDKLKIAPRQVVEECGAVALRPVEFENCVELRPTPGTPAYELTGLPLAKFHREVSQSSASNFNSFIDLNPHISPVPLPTPRDIGSHVMETVFLNQGYRSKLGSGACGSVHLMDCPKWAVAIKHVTNPSDKDAVSREADIMKTLGHPNIVGYFGCGLMDNMLCIAMEWMTGGSIKDFLAIHGPLYDEELIQFAHNLLSGLNYLHSKNIVHHDIKVDNLFFGTSGQLKIGDLGLAQYMVDGVVDTYMVGTAMYMAPEYVRAGKFKPACDIWSAGCAMLEMATGDPPWPRWASFELHRLVYQLGNVSESPILPNHLPHLTCDLMSRCLQIDPGLRGLAVELLQHRLFEGLSSACLGKEEIKPPEVVADDVMDVD